jgi:histidyl-tRNA synthetase
MKIPPVKGTRDFYPSEMAVRNWIIDGWKKVSVRNGFEEYDGPIFEYLKMFQIKSGDEIVEQLFSLRDRGGRDLALRPEITPTLARMVNQRINSLPKPIKWFSVPRLFRAERPQKGRLREFFQWNIDIIGEDSVLADAEVIFCTLDYLRAVGLTADDIVVKISSRKLIAVLLEAMGILDTQLEDLYALLDKRSKLPDDTFEELLKEKVGDSDVAKRIFQLMDLKDHKLIEQIVGNYLDGWKYESVVREVEELVFLFEYLRKMDVDDQFLEFDMSIVRGLAYYTGIVFEIHAKESELRAICGGGRYDNLLRDFGGPKISATGMGMGDCVLEIMLEEKELLQKQLPTRKLDYFIACVDENYKDATDATVKLTMKLRTAGYAANFSYKITKLGKQLKQASEQNAKKCIIIGDEFKDNKLVIKDMTSGQQELVDYNEFLSGLKL